MPHPLSSPWARRGQKPRAGSPVDWSHPIARGLRFASIFNEVGAQGVQNQVDRVIGAFTGSTKPSWAGNRLSFPGGANTVGYLDFGTEAATQDFGKSGDGSHPWSLACRFYPTANSVGIAARNDGNSVSAGWNLITTTTSVRLYFESSTLTGNIDGPTFGGLNRWVDLVITMDGTQTAANQFMYYYGVKIAFAQAVNSSGTPGSDSAQHLFVGRGNTGFASNTSFQGFIDTFYFWNRVLSPGEARALYLNPYLPIVDAGSLPLIIQSSGAGPGGTGAVTIDPPTLDGTGTVATPDARVTQAGLEVFGAAAPPAARVTATSMEVFGTLPVSARVTQTVLEVFGLASTTLIGPPGTPTFFTYEDPCRIQTPIYWGVTKSPAIPAIPNPTYDILQWANAPLRDASNYYGGWKPGRLIAHGPWRRAASKISTGSFEAQSGSFTLADTDRAVRTFLEPHGFSLRGCEVTQYLISNANRVGQGRPRIVFQGLITDDTLAEGLQYTAHVRDVIGSGYNVLVQETQIPQRALEPDFPGFGLQNTDQPQLTYLTAPIIFGTGAKCRADEAATPPKGRLPILYGGQRMCADGVVRHVGILCGHAVAGGIYNVYDETSPTPVSPTWGTDGFAPGKTGWATVNGSAALYTELNGRWYTLIALNVGSALGDGLANGSKKLWCNAPGFGLNSDGSGGDTTEITNLHYIYKYVFLNFLIGNWQKGPWLDSPTFETYPGSGIFLQRVKTSTWDDAAVTGATYVPGGFLGAGVIGVNGQAQSIRDVLAAFNMQAYVSLAVNQYSQYVVRMLDRSRTNFVKAGARAIRDVTDTLASKSLSAAIDQDLLVNHFRGACDLNLRTGKYGALGEIEDGISVARYGYRIPSPELYNFISDSVTGLAVATERLRFRSTARRLVVWRESLCGLRNDMLECVPLTHFSGATSSGYQNRPVWIQSMTINADNTVDIEAYDVEDLMLDQPSEPIGGGSIASPPPTTDPGGTTGGGGAGGTGTTGGGLPGGAPGPSPPDTPTPGNIGGSGGESTPVSEP